MIESAPAEADAHEALMRLLSTRYSCRAFLPAPVPDAVIRRILETAQRTASWCNSQPWQVIVTSGEATRRLAEGLFEHARGHPAQPDIPFPREYAGAYKERRRTCALQLYDSVGVKMGDREASGRQALENYRLFGAPHALIITAPEALGAYGAVDCGAYVANLMLAAHSLGLATIAQAALAGQSPFLRRHFGIPEDRRIVCGVSLGYADADHPANQFRTTRASLEEVVDWRR